MLCSVPDNFHLRLMRNKWHENTRDGRKEGGIEDDTIQTLHKGTARISSEI